MKALAYNHQEMATVLKTPLKIAYKQTNLFQDLLDKKESIAVVGLGYVGLPLALHMAAKYNVVGFDISTSKIENLKNHIDPCEEVASQDFLEKDIQFSATIETIYNSKFFIVAVPTPIDDQKNPNLSPLISATKTVAKSLKEGDIVVFESTVYPGCTEEVCVPILESLSGLTYNKDFFVGYSPERINPGDTVNTFATIKKIVSASHPKALDVVAKVYNEVVTAGIHKATNIKVAEAAKVVENTQRDINIALMNELTFIFDKIGISINDVLEAAGTKWNFLKFFPGLVGGHCIGVDPYYLIHKAKELNEGASLIRAGRNVNEKMPYHLGMKIIKEACKFKKENKDISILIKGITFKENVKDIRNSKVINLIKLLQNFNYDITLEDPYAEAEDVQKHYEMTLSGKEHTSKKYDVVVMAVNHDTYHNDDTIEGLLQENGFVFDVRGTFKHLFNSHKYLSI